MSSILIVYHRADYDGVVSCLIAEKAAVLENELNTVTTLGWNYGDKIPNIQELINEYNQLILVDISFPINEMRLLTESNKAVWIDHHITAIEDSVNNGYSNLPGLRVNGTAACELTWKYFMNTDVPYFIQLLGAYDVWNKNKFDWENSVLPLQYGLNAEYGVSELNLSKDFENILKDDSQVTSFINSGKQILKYLKKIWKSWIKGHAFPITVAGKYKGICLLSPQGGSIQFSSVLEEYDIYISVNRIDSNSYNIGMYMEPNRLDFNCGEYVRATYKNGGGHACACGCKINLEQFIDLIKNKTF